jgi:hypothetical protein
VRVVPLDRRVGRRGRGSLRDTLVIAADWDSLLVAQARCEDLTLVTRDFRCQQYDVAFLPA